jgi:hypothetical protein
VERHGRKQDPRLLLRRYRASAPHRNPQRDNFVRPFIAGFPGNVHAICNPAHARNLAAVEWSFEAVHSGPFANLAPTKKVQLPGCSFYEYDLAKRIIPAGRIYFDLATLMRQITG